MNSALCLGIAVVGLRPPAAMPRHSGLHHQPAEAPLIQTETVSRSSRPLLREAWPNNLRQLAIRKTSHFSHRKVTVKTSSYMIFPIANQKLSFDFVLRWITRIGVRDMRKEENMMCQRSRNSEQLFPKMAITLAEKADHEGRIHDAFRLLSLAHKMLAGELAMHPVHL
jgi:hypothetical protein